VGILSGRMSSRLAFFRLHGSHAETTLRHSVAPPSERGLTWSNVSASAENLPPQYWHRNLSRRKTLNRVNATRLGIGMKSRMATTLGILMVTVGLRTTSSY